MKQILFLFLLFNVISAHAQKEGFNWPVNGGQMITFHTGQPTIMNIPVVGSGSAVSSTSSLSNCQGILQAYSLYRFIFDGQFDTIVGGNVLQSALNFGIAGGYHGYWATCILIPDPANDSVYYQTYFGRDLPLISGYKNNAYLLKVIKDSAHPQGIVNQFLPLYQDSAVSAAAVIRHANGRDFWIVCAKSHDHQFHTYLLTDTGISASPVISVMPSTISHFAGFHPFFAPNHQGNKIAMAYNLSSSSNSWNLQAGLYADYNVFLYDFDNSSGIVSNYQNIAFNDVPNSNRHPHIGGLEFSPNGRYLYASAYRSFTFYQIDVVNPSNVINFSARDSTGFYLQFAVNKTLGAFIPAQYYNLKISPFMNSILFPFQPSGGIFRHNVMLGSILKPNNPYPFNEVNFRTQLLDSVNLVELKKFPSFPQGTIKTVTFENSCATDTIAFQLSSMATVDSVWHKFTGPGEYHMLTIMFRKQGCIDSIRTPFTAQVPPVFSLPNDTLLCEGDTINFNLPNAAVASYFWNDSIYGPKRIFTKDGMYTLDAYNDCGDYIDSFYIAPMNIPDPQISLGGDVRICLGDTLPLNAASPLATYQWHDLSTDSIFLADGTDAQVWVEVSNICGSSRDTANVRTDLNFVDIGQDTIICLNELLPLTFPNTFNRDSLRWNSNNQLFSSLDTISVPVGTVSIEVYNACGIVRDTLQIDTLQPLPPNLQFANPYRICAATQSQIDVTWPGATYAWNTGDTTGILQNPVLANYTVTVSNSCGSQILNLNIRSHQPLQVNLVRDTLLCAGQTFFFLPGIPATQYDSMIWNGNQSANGKMVFAGDSAILAVYNTCGTYRDTGYTHILPIPQISLQADTNICDGDQVTLMLQGQVSPSDNLLWNNGSSDSSILVNQAGNYQISVSNKCGNDSAQITIGILPQPTLVLPQNLVFCQGGNVQIFNTTNPNSSILWNNQITATQYTANSGGWVFATLQDICATLQDSVFVQEDFPLQINFSNDTSLCSNESILLDATQATAEYLWQDGSAQSQFVAANPGTYWVQLSNFCNTTSDTFRITKVLEPALNIPAETILCQNESVEIDASRPENRVIWSDGSQATQRSFESNTQLLLLQFNRCGDTAQATIAVFKTELEDSLQNNNGTLICNYTAGSNYTWYFEGQEIAKNQTSFKPLYKGIYTITFTDSLGCEQILSGYAEGLEKPKCAYWNLYPNPNSGYQISVDYEASKLLKIEVYTALGQLLDVKQMPKNNNEGISTFIWEHTLPLGSYYFRASFTGDCVESRSLIVRLRLKVNSEKLIVGRWELDSEL